MDKIDITSKLDFFIQSTEPRNVKTTDDLVLNATSIASLFVTTEAGVVTKEEPTDKLANALSSMSAGGQGMY